MYAKDALLLIRKYRVTIIVYRVTRKSLNEVFAEYVRGSSSFRKANETVVRGNSKKGR